MARSRKRRLIRKGSNWKVAPENISFLFRNLGEDYLKSVFLSPSLRKQKLATILGYWGGGGFLLKPKVQPLLAQGEYLIRQYISHLGKGQMLDYSVTAKTGKQKFSRSLHACALDIVNSKRSSQAYE